MQTTADVTVASTELPLPLTELDGAHSAPGSSRAARDGGCAPTVASSGGAGGSGSSRRRARVEALPLERDSDGSV